MDKLTEDLVNYITLKDVAIPTSALTEEEKQIMSLVSGLLLSYFEGLN